MPQSDDQNDSHYTSLEKQDPEIFAALREEISRQQQGLELIPSENYVSTAVMSVMGSVLTNKYSEGYPRKRYYGGNEHVDTIEEIARERAMALFKAEHANVQPYSGSPANQAVYMAFLEAGDPVMGLALPDGGHLTHGWGVNFSGKYYHSLQYPVDPTTGYLDYDVIANLAREYKPKLIWSGHSAYPRQIDFSKFAEIASEVGAYHAADIAHISGLVATGLHPDPIPYADAVTMTTHKMLRGPRGALILSKKEHAKAIDKSVFPGLQGGPHNHITAAIAVALHEDLQPEFKQYCHQVLVNAKALAEGLMSRGFKVVTDGTDNHLILVDLSQSPNDIPGKEAQIALDAANITVNANMVPGDKRTAFNPSGIRLGTPAATTRGLVESDMKILANWIADLIIHYDHPAITARVRGEVMEMCQRLPLWY